MYLSLRQIRSYVKHGDLAIVAEELGIHRNTLSRKLHGNLRMSLDDVNKIADAIGVGVEQFLSPEPESELRIINVDGRSYEVSLISDTSSGGYVVECPAIKGCVSQGETEAEALEMIQDAIELCLEVLEDRGHGEVA